MNKNINYSQKEETVNVRSVRQVNENNSNKNNTKEKPSVVSRSVKMRDMSKKNKFNNFLTNIANVKIQSLTDSGGKYNRTLNLNLLSYPEYFTVTSVDDYTYAIKIIKEFEYEIPIQLTYKQILAFQSMSSTKDSTYFDLGTPNPQKYESTHTASKNKYINDVAQDKPWSVWYGASNESPENVYLYLDGVDRNLFDKKVFTGDDSFFKWKGKIGVKIDKKWNIRMSFTTEDGWLPDNKQWIYGNIHIFRNELKCINKYLSRITYYTPPNIDGLEKETVYNDPYDNNKPNVSDWEKYRVIRRIPRVKCFYIPYVGCSGDTEWYNMGLPYYYGPSELPCTNGTVINNNCLQGMGRYIYIRAENNYDIDDGTIFVSKKDANSKFIASCNAHIVGYYDGQYKNDQDIKAKINFMCSPTETNVDPKLFPCVPLTNDGFPLNLTNEFKLTGGDYKVFLRPKLKKNQKWTPQTSVYFNFNKITFTSDLNNIIVNSNNFVDSNTFMAIVSNSDGPISFRLGKKSDGYFFDGLTPTIYFETKNESYTYVNDINITCKNNYLSIDVTGKFMGYFQDDIVSGTFTLVVTQNATSRYRSSVIKIVLRWSINGSSYNSWFDNKKISFTCLGVFDEKNIPLIFDSI